MSHQERQPSPLEEFQSILESLRESVVGRRDVPPRDWQATADRNVLLHYQEQFSEDDPSIDIERIEPGFQVGFDTNPLHQDSQQLFALRVILEKLPRNRLRLQLAAPVIRTGPNFPDFKVVKDIPADFQEFLKTFPKEGDIIKKHDDKLVIGQGFNVVLFKPNERRHAKGRSRYPKLRLESSTDPVGQTWIWRPGSHDEELAHFTHLYPLPTPKSA